MRQWHFQNLIRNDFGDLVVNDNGAKPTKPRPLSRPYGASPLMREITVLEQPKLTAGVDYPIEEEIVAKCAKYISPTGIDWADDDDEEEED